MKTSFISSYTLDDGFVFDGVHLFEKDGRAILVSQAHGTSLFCTSELADDIAKQRIGEGCKLKLIQHGMAKYRQSPYPSTSNENVCPVFFMIDLTKACCLACRYCFRDLTDKTAIADKTLIDICSFILNHAHQNHLKRISIQAWGGEPTLAFEKVKKIYQFFQGSGVEVNLCMETNGVAITDKIATEARAMKMQIGISLDGYPDLHNKQRPCVNDDDSYDMVVRGMQHLYEHGYRKNHQGICVVTRHTLGKAKAVVDHFCDVLGLNLFKFGIIKTNPQMRQRNLEVTPQQAAEFASEMLDAIISKCRSGYAVVESNIRIKLLNLLNRGTSDICFSRGCMGGRKLVTFDQQGNIFSCELMDMQKEAFGSIYSGKDLVTMVREALDTHPFFQRKTSEQCKTCAWHFYCRGGCTSAIRYKAGLYTGGIDEVGCAMNRTLYPKLVELLLTEPDMAQVLVQDKLEVKSS